MRDPIVNGIKNFREEIYHFFEHRRDAALELVDSLSSNTHAKHVVELSLNDVHRRNYCSITRTLGEYYEGVDKAEKNGELNRVLSACCPELIKRDHHLFALDCTSNPRLFSKTLADRSIVHAPNQVIGNKPITVGHQYSVVVYLPEKLAGGDRPWVIPQSCERVSTEDKATLLGMNQLSDCLSQKAFKERLCVSVGDSAYSHSGCITEANKNPHQVHISRAKGNRIFYDAPKTGEQNKRGRPKRYGQKFRLNSDPLPKADESFVLKWITQKGKEQTVNIECWNNKFMRGHRESDTSKIPVRLVKVTVSDASRKQLFKRPMWLVIVGVRQHELSLADIYHSYCQRFDIEHFFKFGKNRLLMDKLQTPKVENEEAFWQLSLIAYTQLYLARHLAEYLPTPWGKYVDKFKSPASKIGPAQVQNSFSRIIATIGTPTQAPKPRNKSSGRKKGEVQIKRPIQKVVIKSQNKPLYNQMLM